MRNLQFAVTLLAGTVVSAGYSAAQKADLRAVFTAPVNIARAEPVTSVPLEMRMNKLFLNAAANGHSREFIFDTGSPTILNREFADSLGLKIIGQNTGVDAHGNQVTMDVAVLDSLSIGDTTFYNVPVLIFDYGKLDMGSCFLDGGFLGSEILPGSAWRIDLQNKRLSIAETTAELGGSDPAVEAKLHDFGYPHAPIVDYSVGEVSDKALFDTGNAEQVTLVRGVAKNSSVRKKTVPGSVRIGRGSEGVSAGGRGQLRELVRFTLSDFLLDGESVGAVRATTRDIPPTLIGAGMLATHVVTLDYPEGRLLLEERSEPGTARAESGYSVAFEGDHATVVRLFENSTAASAGLKLGDRVTELQGRSLVVTPANPKCSSAKWLAESFDPSLAANIVVQRNGASITINVPATGPGESAASN